MSIEIYFFRHGETRNNESAKFISGRSSSIPLNQRGENQSYVLGDRIDEEITLHKIYSSTALRSQQTAQNVSSIIHFPLEEIVYSPCLEEVSQGEWEGRLRSELYSASLINQIEKDPLNFRAPNGESLKQGGQRIYDYLLQNVLIPKHDKLAIGVFGHGLAFKSFLQKIMDFNPSLTTNIAIDNCSISLLEYNHSRPHQPWKLIKLNDNSHLTRVGYSSNAL